MVNPIIFMQQYGAQHAAAGHPNSETAKKAQDSVVLPFPRLVYESGIEDQRSDYRNKELEQGDTGSGSDD